MIFEGNRAVIEALKEKKLLMDSGKDHGHIRPLVIVDGGLMKVAYSVGTGLAFEELGYTDVFSTIVGVSSGAPSAAYFLAGSVAYGSRLLYEECCSKRFVNLWRFWNQVDTKYIASVLEGATDKAINTEKLFSSPTRLLIGVTERITAHPVLLEPKTKEQLITAIRASILMPNVSSDSVIYNGVSYVDGGFSSPHIVEKVLTDVDATHVLVLTNQEQNVSTVPRREIILNNTLFRFRLSTAVRHAAERRREERNRVLSEYLHSQKVPLAVVWGDNSIDSFEQDAGNIKKTIEASRVWWHRLLQNK